MTLSTAGTRNALATSADENLLKLVEITHRDLAIPARFVDDTQDIIVEGNLFTATRFRLVFPDDIAEQTPQARLAVDNISRELTQFLEISNGGAGSRCRIMAVLRSAPAILQADITLDLGGLSIDNMEVSGSLGFQNSLALPAVAKRYDPITAPGLF